ncbi:hypothetical protein IFR09_16985 [Pseudomonas syringae]|nr:hypothetical protein [Pseudomonas syringae]MBD8802315.1 hypothetical protein [Pseudomonas syringae]MBD8812860.1 hypothetical protein [Pseudomonas syringae]
MLKTYLLNDQFLLFGAVDIPATTENSMKLFKSLGDKGFFPQIVREINSENGAVLNRLGFTNTADMEIVFNTDRVQISKAGPAEGRSAISLEEVSRGVCEILQSEFNLSMSRVVLISEKLVEDSNKDRFESSHARFINAADVEGMFEWQYRTTRVIQRDKATFLGVQEVSRAHGTMVMNGNSKNFDAIRMRIEMGTNVLESNVPYTPLESFGLYNKLLSEVESSFKVLDGIYNG